MSQVNIIVGAEAAEQEQQQQTTENLLSFVVNFLSSKEQLKIENIGCGKFSDQVSKIVHEIVENKSSKGVIIGQQGEGVCVIENSILCISTKLNSQSKIQAAIEKWLEEEENNQNSNKLEDSKISNGNSERQINVPEEVNCMICKMSELQAPKSALHGDASTEWTDVPGVQGVVWKLYREDCTTALVKFPKGAFEPPHHHTIGHGVFVYSGEKTVENLKTGEKFLLKKGDFLYTPPYNSHKVYYHTEVEFFFQCDGQFDIFWDTEENKVFVPNNEE